MRRAIYSFACVVGLSAMLCAPAVAAPANGQLAAVADGRLVALNPDGSGLRTLPVPDAQSITELAWSPGGNRIAFARAGDIGVLELATGRVLSLTSGAGDANLGWSSDGTKVGFRRGLQTMTVLAAGGTAPEPVGLLLQGDPLQIAWGPNLQGPAVVVAGLLVLPLFKTPPLVVGAPAWSLDGSALAYATGDGLATIAVAGGDAVPVTTGPAEAPHWSPDSRSLLYSTGSELRTVPLAGGPSQTVLSASRVGAADWQHCSENTATCVSVSPPRCSAAAVSAITPVDQPIDLPAPPCTDPAGRPLSVTIVKAPERGTLSGLRYTPAAGFVGQDTLNYRVNNGVYESETVKLTVFVLARAASTPTAKPPVLVRRAPFLSARSMPRLDRRRRALAQLSCDQDCSIVVRLTARLRSKRTLNGPQLKRSVTAGHVLSLRLRLPTKPRGTLKTVWITGRVRNPAGDLRSVKLPVRLPR
jgi:dipeptidyl aminopeptidase/acylaminoacyl peptidase